MGNLPINVEGRPGSIEERPDSPARSRAARSLRVAAAGRTDAGRIRRRNEDRYLIIRPASPLRERLVAGLGGGRWLLECSLLVVADGMGGHQGGETASAMAVSTVVDRLLPALQALRWHGPRAGVDLPALLREAMEAADEELYEHAEAHTELSGMGTTLTIACHVGDLLTVAHAGDSRGYLLRAGQLTQLTQDHTLVQEMVRAGRLSPEGAARHQLRHLVTNALGGGSLGVDVETCELRLESGDQVLLCSDGLTGMVPEARIGTVLLETEDARQACDRLIDEANQLGGRDNVTAIVARFE